MRFLWSWFWPLSNTKHVLPLSGLSQRSADIRFLSRSQGRSITFRNSFWSFLTSRALLLFPISVSHFPPSWLGTQRPRVMCGMLSLPGHHLGQGLICCLQKLPWSLGVWDVGTRRLLRDEGREAGMRGKRQARETQWKSCRAPPWGKAQLYIFRPKAKQTKRKPVC